MLRLDSLADLLKRPVLVAYLGGIAVVMVTSQLGKLLGIAVDAEGFLPELAYVARHLGDVHVPTLVLGLMTLVAMLAGSAFFPRAPVALLGLLGATAVVAVFGLVDHGVELVGTIRPACRLPGCRTSMPATCGPLLIPALGVAFVAYTDNILTGRAFASKHGESIDRDASCSPSLAMPILAPLAASPGSTGRSS